MEKDDKLKKLIQKAGTESPPPGFTDLVMHSVQLEVQNEMVMSSNLKNLLQQISAEKPSADFMKTVIAQVESQAKAQSYKVVVEPVISKKVWYIVAAASIAMITLLGFLYNSIGEIPASSSSITGMDKAFSLVSYNISNLPFAYSMSLIAISSLLFLDYFLRNNILKRAF